MHFNFRGLPRLKSMDLYENVIVVGGGNTAMDVGKGVSESSGC